MKKNWYPSAARIMISAPKMKNDALKPICPLPGMSKLTPLFRSSRNRPIAIVIVPRKNVNGVRPVACTICSAAVLSI